MILVLIYRNIYTSYYTHIHTHIFQLCDPHCWKQEQKTKPGCGCGGQKRVSNLLEVELDGCELPHFLWEWNPFLYRCCRLVIAKLLSSPLSNGIFEVNLLSGMTTESCNPNAQMDRKQFNLSLRSFWVNSRPAWARVWNVSERKEGRKKREKIQTHTTKLIYCLFVKYDYLPDHLRKFFLFKPLSYVWREW